MSEPTLAQKQEAVTEIANACACIAEDYLANEWLTDDARKAVRDVADLIYSWAVSTNAMHRLAAAPPSGGQPNE